MKLIQITKDGTTKTRKEFWDAISEVVNKLQKIQGKNVSINVQQGYGTIINASRDAGTPPPPEGCPGEDIDEITVVFSGIVACPCLGSGTESFLGTDLGLNASFVLPRISSTTFQLSTSALYRVTKWSPNTNCSGSIEFEHESACLVQASCNATTHIWTVAIQDQVDFFFGFFGRGETMPIAAEGVCDFPTSPDLFHQGAATISF